MDGKKKEGKRTQGSKYSKQNTTRNQVKTENKPKKKKAVRGTKLPTFDDKVRLNKYLSNAGICSRREADTLIKTGVVSVNGKMITEMGYKVSPSDTVEYDGMKLQLEKKQYVLLNKPKDFSLKYDVVTKKSVYPIIKKACKEDIFPVGKLETSACGLVLFTNDSDMVKKLTHPKFKVSQLFHVVLDKPISENHLKQLTKGMYVDNAMFSAEEADYVKGKSLHEIGVKIRSSKSNSVKLMLGKLGYTITKLDRVEYAGLTKLDLPRGHYRALTKKEIGFLKMS